MHGLANLLDDGHQERSSSKDLTGIDARGRMYGMSGMNLQTQSFSGRRPSCIEREAGNSSQGTRSATHQGIGGIAPMAKLRKSRNNLLTLHN